MMVRRPSTFGELISLRRTMDRVLADPFFRPAAGPRPIRHMPLDVFETPDALVLEAALPGVKPEDVDISVLGDVLTLTAGSDQSAPDVPGDYQVREMRRGRMSRSVTLPSGLRPDATTASYEDGLLRLSIPRAVPAERRSIPLTVTSAAAPDGADCGPASTDA